MALNLQTFKTRSLTAVVFVIVMLAGLLWNAWAFIILFTLIHFGCWYEFVELVKKMRPRRFINTVSFGFIYITLPVLLIADLRLTYLSGPLTDNTLKVIPCGIIFSLWINDTMQYIVGSLIGKHPFSKISPKKTWEGTIGGSILCIIVITLIGKWTGFYRTTDWIAISAICALFGTLGDLLESKIKRVAAVKDSGTLMPGHGGFLDRFDSLLIAVPFVWVYVHLFMQW
jgi:phosphatidate cytidylyltransferase